MPLYDAYGVLIKPKDPETTKSKQTPPNRAASGFKHWFKTICGWSVKYVARIVPGIGFAASLLAFLVIKTDISVEPYVMYDAADPFSQRFEIVNNGVLPIYEVHYTCSITFSETNNAALDAMTNRIVPVMIPIAPHIAELRSKEKRSTDCDFLFRLGDSLHLARIEINVFYRPFFRRFAEFHSAGDKFNARRDTTGKFIWDRESADIGPFDVGAEPDTLRPPVFMPFAGAANQCPNASDFETLRSDFERLLSAARLKKGGRWRITIPTPANVPCNWKTNK